MGTAELSSGIKWPGSETDHSAATSAEVKSICQGTELRKKDKFTFTNFLTSGRRMRPSHV
jgi:hypothetical protein